MKVTDLWAPTDSDAADGMVMSVAEAAEIVMKVGPDHTAGGGIAVVMLADATVY